jgi:hypothetical protein
MAGAIIDFIDHMKSNSSGRDHDVTVATVASNVKSGSHKRFTLKKHVKPDMVVEDQYYSQQEYVGLLAVQKYTLKLKQSKGPSEKKKMGSLGVTLAK